MNRHIILVFASLLSVTLCFAQKPEPKDSTKKTAWTIDLNPVVVTGQYKPQELNKSIYRVEVITKLQIQNMAVSNVAELLKQQLNIEIENQTGTGRSKIRVLGLDSQYTKILMDNIPIAGDQNMGSDVDLSTISLDDVERVEIIKGAMGVEYGANSISGVINIITKKTARNKTDIKFEIQEETVRSEYNLKTGFASKGRHRQGLNLSHKITNNFSAGLALSRDQFNGYWGDYQGRGYMKQGTDKRGYDWSPKTALNGNIFLNYVADRFSVYYKINAFRSFLTNYSHFAQGFLLKDEDLVICASTNNDYNTTRWNHHLNLRGNFWRASYYSFDFSFQKNSLQHRRQAINLHDNSVLDKSYGIPGSDRLKATDWEKHYQSAGFYSKGTLLQPVFTDKLNIFLGYELDNTTGNQGYTSYFADVSLNKPVENTLLTGSAFASFEWNISPKIMVRPGFRLNYCNRSKTIIEIKAQQEELDKQRSRVKMRTNQSITTRYSLNSANDLRLILGTSTRFPNYDELFSWFVNSIHDFRGNPNLKPEYGKSIELQWAYKKDLAANLRLETNLSSMYQHLTDRIVAVVIPIPGSTQITERNTYENENNYNALLNQANINLLSDKFHLAVGASLLGYRGDSDKPAEAYGDFLLNTQVNAQLSTIFSYDFRLSLFYRYVGKQPLYVMGVQYDENGKNPVFYKDLHQTNPHHSLSFNIAKSFFNKKLDLRIGAKNLFDVTDLKYNPVDPKKKYPPVLRVQRLYYGRSYFLKISYTI